MSPTLFALIFIFIYFTSADGPQKANLRSGCHWSSAMNTGVSKEAAVNILIADFPLVKSRLGLT